MYFLPVDSPQAAKLNLALRYDESHGVVTKAVQLVRPDPCGRFPWERGYLRKMRREQPQFFSIVPTRH